MTDFLSPLRHLLGEEVPWPPSMGPAPAPAPAVPSPDQPDIVDTSSFNTGLMVFLLVVWASIGHKVASRSRYLGEGSVACGMGLAAGAILLVVQHFTAIDKEALRQLLTFNPADFFTYFLPPIIFFAGLSVKKKKFFRNFGSIATLGILGTYILFAIIAFFLYAISMLPNLLTFTDCLALGAIFAATDTVAVLQVIRPEEAGVLYSLVFGEGVMNDATSVAILRAVQSYSSAKTGVAAGGSMMGIFVDFLYLFVASLILGMVFGLGTAVLLKFLKSDSSPQEVALIGMLAYLSYLCGELLGISGIVSLFCCGVVISHYALHNVTSMTRVTTVSAFQTLSYIAEGCIFIYVGLDTLDPLKWTNTYFSELIWLFVVLLVLLLVGRALYVVPACWLHNMWSSEKVSVRDVVIIWWGGLMRGAVSVALIYRYFDPHGQAQLDAHRSTLITTTLLLVLFSTMVFGALTKPLFDLVKGHESEELSNMMELMPHRRKRGRGRAQGLGGMNPDTRSTYGGSGGSYAVVDMHPMAEPGTIELEFERHLEGTESVGAESELSLQSGSSGSLHQAQPELNGLDDPDRWWRKAELQRQKPGLSEMALSLGGPGTQTQGVGSRAQGTSGEGRQRDTSFSPWQPNSRTGAGYSAPRQVPPPPGTIPSPHFQLSPRTLSQQQQQQQQQRVVASPAASPSASVPPYSASHQRRESNGGIIAFNERQLELEDQNAQQGSGGLEADGDDPVQVDPAAAGEAAPLIVLGRESSREVPGSIAILWRNFDAEYMQPIFGGPGSFQRVTPPSSNSPA